jgi:hypothetical protein
MLLLALWVSMALRAGAKRHHAATRLGVLASLDFLPYPPAQRVVYPHPDALLAPLLEVVVDGALGRKRAGQQLPLVAGLQLVEQPVEDGSKVDPPLWAGLGPYLHIRADHLPLGIGQVEC